jgi:23S rRNA pseudouridine1911/1915/1917 synthase
MPGSLNKLFFPVTSSVRGQRLDQVVCAHVEGWSRSRLQAWIRAGRVRLSGKVVRKPGLILMEEGEIEVELALPEVRGEKPRVSELVVLYSDPHILVIDKPAGLLTHGNAPSEPTQPNAPGVHRSEASVADLAREKFGEMPSSGPGDRPGIVHRLDRETSGVMVLARTDEALAELKRQFKERAVEKTYLALVHGDPRFDSDWIEKPLGRREHARDRISIMPEGEGREAVTYFEVRERFVKAEQNTVGAQRAARGARLDESIESASHSETSPRDAVALLAVFPKTGRTHQVRVHLASIGLPLVGETVYLPRRRGLPKLPAGAPALERQALHAHVLSFQHPLTHEALRFESPLPPDIGRLLAWLRAARPV